MKIRGAKHALLLASICTLLGASASAVAANPAPPRGLAIRSEPASPAISDRVGELLGVSALSPTDVWAVGFAGTDVASTALVEHWDGHRWARVPAPHGSDSSLTSVTAVSATDIWAAGYVSTSTHDAPLVDHWDGSSWQRVTTPKVDGSLTGISADSADDAWAVGNSDIDGRGLIEHWDGQAWTMVNDPSPGGLVSVSADSPTDAWAVGYRVEFRTLLTEHWDGTQWSTVNAVQPDRHLNQLNAVVALPSGTALIVGNDDGDGGGGLTPDEMKEYTLAESWNGSAWTQQPSASPKHSSYLLGVAATGDTDAWAVGGAGVFYFPAALIEHWSGTQWRSVETNAPAGVSQLDAVSADSSSDAWAVGLTYSDSTHILVEHWDGTSWQQV